ncbi:MAG TPA: Rap1a/Tai family immunity protein [Aestuariivirga sp.]
MRLPLLATLLLLTGTNILHANVTGQNLEEYCAPLNSQNSTDPTEPMKSGMCFGYIQAAIEGLVSLQNEKQTDETLKFCIPEGVKLRQNVEVVWRFIASHPEALHKPAFSIIWAAEVTAFPCSK